MAREDVERFVGLLVSDETFVEALKRNFDRAIVDRGIKLDARERTVLKEGFETYVRPEAATPLAVGGPSVAAIPAAAVGAAVAASVAGSVAGNVATKVVDKLTNSALATPVNVRLRESIIARGLLKESDFEGVREIRQPPVLRPFAERRTGR
ncbi:MAG: hypothetical protein HY675_24635 [Chloroflexi bacterium]|nr:hypothetical protein [Chloroflexota bacterium]